jgi:hypothetical protein
MSDASTLVVIIASLIYLIVYRRDKTWGSFFYILLSLGTFVLTKGTDNAVFSVLFLLISIISFLSNAGEYAVETTGGAISRIK